MEALGQIPQTWQDWVSLNLEKQVAPEQLSHSLFKEGYVDAAIELLKQQRVNPKIPLFDMSQNRIRLSDREVDILFTCYQPLVGVFADFLSHEECNGLIEIASDQLKESQVVNAEDGTFVKHDARTSTSIGFQRGATPLLSTIESRIGELLQWRVENGEGLQVLRYEDGGEYRPHYDYFDPAEKSSAVVTQKGGQRVGTFLMYLSDVEQGGATKFPKMNFEVRPKKGMAIYFANTYLDGSIDPLTLHAGMPVIKGVKFLATKWLREKPYV